MEVPGSLREHQCGDHGDEPHQEGHDPLTGLRRIGIVLALIAVALTVGPAPTAGADGGGGCASGDALCFRVVGDSQSSAREYGVSAAELPALSDSSDLAGQRLEMCLAGSPDSPLDSPADLSSMIADVTGVSPQKVAFVSIARPSGAGYAVADTRDLVSPDFLHRAGCSDRPLVFLDGGRISYLRPQRTASDNNSLDYLSTEGGSAPLMVVVHTAGSFISADLAVSGELRLGSPITITATNSELDSGWSYNWACASANQVAHSATGAVTCAWGSTGNFSVALTAQGDDGSMAYGATLVRIGPAALSPTDGASSTASPGSSAGASDSGGKGSGSPTVTSTAGSGSSHDPAATPTASPSATPTASPSAVPVASPSVAVPAASRPTAAATRTPTTAAGSSATRAEQDLTGYLLTVTDPSEPAAESATESGADQVRSGGSWLSIPDWVWGLALVIAALGAGALAESWWRLARSTRPERRRSQSGGRT